jgi:phospholipid/cholesterol/gamma-HCH transport system substrate-binding protein
MMQKRTIEIGVGVFVAAGIAALVMLAMKVSNLAAFTNQQGYEVTARFDNIGGLKERSAVTVAGVRIGRVKSIVFDDKDYEAVVTMNIESQHDRLPADTSASILTAGLLGEQYVALEPGGDEAFLKQGGDIKLTQSAIILEKMVGRFLFDKAAGEDGKKEEGAAP